MISLIAFTIGMSIYGGLSGAQPWQVIRSGITLDTAMFNCQSHGYVGCNEVNGVVSHGSCPSGYTDTSTSCVMDQSSKGNPPQSSANGNCPTGTSWNGQTCVYQQQAQYGEIPSPTATTPCTYLSFITFDLVTTCKPVVPSDNTCPAGEITNDAGTCVSTTNTPPTYNTPPGPSNLPVSTGPAESQPNSTNNNPQSTTNSNDPFSQSNGLQTEISSLQQQLQQLQAGSNNANSGEIAALENQITTLLQEQTQLQSQIASQNKTDPVTAFVMANPLVTVAIAIAFIFAIFIIGILRRQQK